MYCAIDQSTNLNGYATFLKPYQLGEYGIIDLSSLPKSTDQDQAEKRYQFLQQLKPIIWRNHIKQIITEGVYFHNNADTHRKLACMQGCIQDFARSFDIICFSWGNAGEWRSVLGIKGKKREEYKEVTKQYAISMYELPNNLTEDIYDAVCVGTAYFKMLEQKGIK